MGHQEDSSTDNLNTHLHSTNNLVDRLLQGNGRILRKNNTGVGDQHQNTRRSNDAAMRKLEKEMDKLTDPLLLLDAIEYQQGQCRMTLLLGIEQI